MRTKNQDFALSRKLHVRASHTLDFKNAITVTTDIAYVATEVKTNLDKTMFQEACATARDLRTAVPTSRYFLMCEWLDMTPIRSGSTDITEVLVLRAKKRVASDIRKDFNTADKRSKRHDWYVKHLASAPLRADVFERWVEHVKMLLKNEVSDEEDVLEKGYF